MCNTPRESITEVSSGLADENLPQQGIGQGP